MIAPFKSLNIKPGDKPSIVNDCSIWNSQFKLRLLNLSQNLQNAIQKNDRRDVEYFMGLITRLQYHPTIGWSTFVPIDMLLLPQTPRCLRKRLAHNRKKSQSAQRRRGGTGRGPVPGSVSTKKKNKDGSKQGTSTTKKSRSVSTTTTKSKSLRHSSA